MYERDIGKLAYIFREKLEDDALRKVYRENMAKYKNSVLEGKFMEEPIRTYYIRKEAARLAAECKGVDLYD